MYLGTLRTVYSEVTFRPRYVEALSSLKSSVKKFLSPWSPASIDRWPDDIPEISGIHSADKQDGEGVLDSGELGIVDTRLLYQCFSSLIEVDFYWIEPQLWFAW